MTTDSVAGPSPTPATVAPHEGILGETDPLHDVALPWPSWVHRATATLPLPPTMTAHGPITWTHPPEADALRLCREVEVFAALCTALRDQLSMG